MNKNTLGIIAIIASCVAAYLYFENKKLERKLIVSETDRLKLIIDSIKQNTTLTEELKEQLTKLVYQFENVDSKVSAELIQVLQLFEIGQIEKAIADLVKIIEYLLSVHYKENQSFLGWLKQQKKQLNFSALLDFCKNEKKINNIEYKFFIALKEIRNKEVHELDLNNDPYLNASGIIVAIGAIIKISDIVFPNQKIKLK